MLTNANRIVTQTGKHVQFSDMRSLAKVQVAADLESTSVGR
jgi:hypothetical protein